MKDLQIGKKYKCTCLNGQYCTLHDIVEVIDDNIALVSIIYRNRLYIVTSYNLYN